MRLYLHTTCSDLTEGRGWTVPLAFYSTIDAARRAWKGSGVQGTEAGAAVYVIDLDPSGVPKSLWADGICVIGEHPTFLGWTNGLIPATPQRPWSNEKQKRFRELAREFPEMTPPKCPTIVDELIAQGKAPEAAGAQATNTDVFLLVEETVRGGGDYRWRVLGPLGAYSSVERAVAAAALYRQATPYAPGAFVRTYGPTGGHGQLHVVGPFRTGDPIRDLAADRKRDDIVWSETRTNLDPKAAAAFAEYQDMLAEMERCA